MALLEAMACGCAVVATRAGGIPEIITDGVNGLLVPPGDAQALAKALARVAGDTQLREQLGRKARLRAETFRIEGTVAALEQVYEDILQSASS